jgi:hypothetical protein
MFANGNSFSGSNGQAVNTIDSIRRPVPTWKFGVSPESYNSDRGDM